MFSHEEEMILSFMARNFDEDSDTLSIAEQIPGLFEGRFEEAYNFIIQKMEERRDSDV